jgi:hypothetical protein
MDEPPREVSFLTRGILEACYSIQNKEITFEVLIKFFLDKIIFLFKLSTVHNAQLTINDVSWSVRYGGT